MHLNAISICNALRICRASVLPFQKCVNSVSGFANSVFYRFRFAKFRFYRFRYLKFCFIFSSRIFVVNNFCFQHSFSFSILIKKFYSVTVLRWAPMRLFPKLLWSADSTMSQCQPATNVTVAVQLHINFFWRGKTAPNYCENRIGRGNSVAAVKQRHMRNPI